MKDCKVELIANNSLCNNRKIINKIMANWKCTELEANAALEFGTATLEET